MKAQRLLLMSLFSLLLLGGLFVVLRVSASPAARVAIVVVNTLEDELNDDGDCSLREAISAANNNIQVDACGSGEPFTDTITFSVKGTIALTEQLSVIAGGPLLIDGGETITVSGNHNVRVFFINAGSKVNLHNLTMIHGDASDGGGIWNFGSLTINKSALSSNSAAYDGGGILNDSGSLYITDSTLSGNSATWGGGILNTGTLIMINSTLSGNSATNNGGGGGIMNDGMMDITNSTMTGNYGGQGGGIINGSNGTLNISFSSFSGNDAYDGGGIMNHGVMDITHNTLSGNISDEYGGGIVNSGTLTVTNSTLFGNMAENEGGGIYNTGNPLIVTNSTLSGNSANHGGGILNTGTAMLYNTIVVDSPLGGNCQGAIADGGHNIEDTNTCGFGLDSWSNTDPLLAPLGDNGGPTWTHALLTGSPAIDNADPMYCPETDQRGVMRPFDGNFDGTPECDIGSFELQMIRIFLPIVSFHQEK